MNRKVPMWTLLLSLAFAFVGFGLWGKSNLDHFDREYGLHAEEFYSKGLVLELLNKNQIKEAKDVLAKETKNIGAAVAICLMNNCSAQAKKVRDEYREKYKNL